MFDFTPECEAPDCTHPQDPADRDTNGVLDIMYVHTDCGEPLIEARLAELLDLVDSANLTLESFRS
jgi:hypothetical protein